MPRIIIVCLCECLDGMTVLVTYDTIQNRGQGESKDSPLFHRRLKVSLATDAMLSCSFRQQNKLVSTYDNNMSLQAPQNAEP